MHWSIRSCDFCGYSKPATHVFTDCSLNAELGVDRTVFIVAPLLACIVCEWCVIGFCKQRKGQVIEVRAPIRIWPGCNVPSTTADDAVVFQATDLCIVSPLDQVAAAVRPHESLIVRPDLYVDHELLAAGHADSVRFGGMDTWLAEYVQHPERRPSIELADYGLPDLIWPWPRADEDV